MAKVGVRIWDNDRHQTGKYKFVHQASMGGALIYVLVKSGLLVNGDPTAKVTKQLRLLLFAMLGDAACAYPVRVPTHCTNFSCLTVICKLNVALPDTRTLEKTKEKWCHW